MLAIFPSAVSIGFDLYFDCHHRLKITALLFLPWNKTFAPCGTVRLLPCVSYNCDVDVFLRPKPLDSKPEFVHSAEAFPLQRLPFNGLRLSAPRDARSYLDRVYGREWQRNVRVFHNHMFCRPLMAMPVGEYQAQLERCGYQAPRAKSTAAAALAWQLRLLLERHGCAHCSSYEEMEQELWRKMGWGSPLGVPEDAWKPDSDQEGA